MREAQTYSHSNIFLAKQTRLLSTICLRVLGADLLAQQYLFDKTDAVVVYHMFTSPRNNVGFSTRGGFKSDVERDAQMTHDSHQDIAWVRLGREQSGTQANLDRRFNCNTNANFSNR